jgi:hypothetical protein
MTTVAIVTMILAGLLIWGGLVVSILLLRRDARGAVTGEDVQEVRDPYDVTPGHHGAGPRAGDDPESPTGGAHLR